MRYPGALWRPITRNYTARNRATTRGVILHVAASEAASLRGWFNDPRAAASSQLYVRRDGTVEQYTDARAIAWASGEANPTTIGVETQGMGSGRWTDAQVEALARICAWAHHEFGVPLEPMRTSKATERGIGYHALGVPINASQKARGVSQTGGELWSKAVGKICPGPDRIRQIPTIIARARELAGRGVAPGNPQENEDDMPKLTDKIALASAAKGVLGRENISYGGATQYAAAGGWEAMQRLPRIEATLKAQAAAIEALAKNAGVDPKRVDKVIAESVEKALSGIKITGSLTTED